MSLGASVTHYGRGCGVVLVRTATDAHVGPLGGTERVVHAVSQVGSSDTP
jgi:hypothetical protein